KNLYCSPSRIRMIKEDEVVQAGSGVQPISYPMGTGSSFPGVKRPWRETDHSLPNNAEVKNGGAIYNSPIRLHGIVLY
ncbi:hypothetical protein B7P43_G11604, partial [Cryptotermes secundus]